MTLRLRYAAKSDVGLLREGNEDSAYAGPHLLAVADGMGGHAHGEVASAGTIATLAPLDEEIPGDDPSAALERAVRQANDELRQMVEGDPSLEGMGTTLTAMLWTGEQAALVHVGDSRAYLLRDGELHRTTRDHTLVQSLIDEGRIDEEEAAVHPQRSLLLRALDGRTEVEPDLSTAEFREGDRYLLCSDGLSGVVSEDTLRETLNAGWDPERVVEQLIELANRGGGPDNITCVVADAVEAAEGTVPPAVVAGAAAHAVEPSDDTISMETSAGRAAALMRDGGEEQGGEVAGPRPRQRWPRILLFVVVLAAALGGVSYTVWHYARSQYYVGAHDGEVVIFRGVSQQVAGKSLSRVHSRTGLPLEKLPTFERSAVADNIQANSLNGAEAVVQRLRGEARSCMEATQAGDRRSPTEQRGGQRTAGGGDAGHGQREDSAQSPVSSTHTPQAQGPGGGECEQ